MMVVFYGVAGFTAIELGRRKQMKVRGLLALACPSLVQIALLQQPVLAHRAFLVVVRDVTDHFQAIVDTPKQV